MQRCQFCTQMASNTLHGIHICTKHYTNPAIEGIICDFYKKEHEIMGRNYNIMKRKSNMAYTRPWKNLIEYYRAKWGWFK